MLTRYTFFTLIFTIAIVASSSWLTPAQAVTAKIKPLRDQDIYTQKVKVRFAKISAAKKYKFELWDKREGRATYRKVRTFYKKYSKKHGKTVRMKVKELSVDRDYRIRYRPVYAGDRLGLWSKYRTFRTANTSITFNLTTDSSLPAGDVPYVVINDNSTTSATIDAYAMTSTGDTTWQYELENITNSDIVKYVYSRNNLGAASYEQFSPDDPTELRSITVDSLPVTKDQTITSWRWLDSSVNTGSLPVDGNYVITDRSQFITSIGLPETFDGIPSDLITSTMQNIAENGFDYVTIYYSPRMITNATDTVTTTTSTQNTPSSTEIVELIQAANAAGLEVILSLQLNVDPDDAANINDALYDTEHENSYFTTYMTRWREAMNDGVDVAEANGVNYLVLFNPFPDFSYTNSAQKSYVSTVFGNDIVAVPVSSYTGTVITSNFESDADMTWYSNSAIDWIGVEWEPDLTSSTSPTVADMKTDAVTDIASTIQVINTTYSKPAFFHQLNVGSWNGAAGGDDLALDSNAVDPTKATNASYSADYQEQADTYEALFQAIADTSYIVGATTSNYTYATQLDKGSNVRDKIAEQVWQRWDVLFDAQVN